MSITVARQRWYPALPLASRLAWYAATLDPRCAPAPDERLDDAAVRRELDEMARTPVRLARPVLVLTGWRAPRLQSMMLRDTLQALTGAPDAQFIAAGYPWAWSVNDAAAEALAALVERFGSRGAIPELDVVAISMGGLVARLLATRPGAARESNAVLRGAAGLRVRRLFTLATPHAGAIRAELARLDECSRQMHAGSAFLRALDAELLDSTRPPGSPSADRFELRCFAIRHDLMVGTDRCAPPGHAARVVEGPRLLSHALIWQHPRVLLEVAGALRSGR